MKDKFNIILLYFWLLNGIKYMIQFFLLFFSTYETPKLKFIFYFTFWKKIHS
jgi:hypothetical protein